MHDHLKNQVELMGYKPENVQEDTHTEQDFLIMSRLMRITRTSDFTEEELELYKMAAATAVEDVRYVAGSRILTPEFTEEELKCYQWSAEHPTGSCRGFCLTDDPRRRRNQRLAKVVGVAEQAGLRRGQDSRQVS